LSPYSRQELFVADEVAQLRQERDLYLGLLSWASNAISTRSSSTRSLIVELTGARQGYIELSIDGPDGKPRTWSIAHAYAGVDRGLFSISRGIIAEAMASGTTVLTPSALLTTTFPREYTRRRDQRRAVHPSARTRRSGDLPGRHVRRFHVRRKTACGPSLRRAPAPLAERLVLRELSGRKTTVPRRCSARCVVAISWAAAVHTLNCSSRSI
jgi:hypothetical protein